MASHDKPEAPQPRLCAASAVLFDKHPFVFGGWDPSAREQGNEILHDIVPFQFGDKAVSDDAFRVSLDQPTSRHVAVTISDDTILLHTHRCEDFVWLFEQILGILMV